MPREEIPSVRILHSSALEKPNDKRCDEQLSRFSSRVNSRNLRATAAQSSQSRANRQVTIAVAQFARAKESFPEWRNDSIRFAFPFQARATSPSLCASSGNNLHGNGRRAKRGQEYSDWKEKKGVIHPVRRERKRGNGFSGSIYGGNEA